MVLNAKVETILPKARFEMILKAFAKLHEKSEGMDLCFKFDVCGNLTQHSSGFCDKCRTMECINKDCRKKFTINSNHLYDAIKLCAKCHKNKKERNNRRK